MAETMTAQKEAEEIVFHDIDELQEYLDNIPANTIVNVKFEYGDVTTYRVTEEADGKKKRAKSE